MIIRTLNDVFMSNFLDLAFARTGFGEKTLYQLVTATAIFLIEVNFGVSIHTTKPFFSAIVATNCKW